MIPELLFLDEPTANLDPEASKTVREFILELKKEKRTIFLNTHMLDEADNLRQGGDYEYQTSGGGNPGRAA